MINYSHGKQSKNMYLVKNPLGLILNTLFSRLVLMTLFTLPTNEHLDPSMRGP